MKNKNQEIEKQMQILTDYINTPEGEQSLKDSMDEWFTMGNIVEEVDEEYPDLTNEEFIAECLKRHEKIYTLDQESRNLWIKTLKDMLSR